MDYGGYAADQGQRGAHDIDHIGNQISALQRHRHTNQGLLVHLNQFAELRVLLRRPFQRICRHPIVIRFGKDRITDLHTCSAGPRLGTGVLNTRPARVVSGVSDELFLPRQTSLITGGVPCASLVEMPGHPDVLDGTVGHRGEVDACSGQYREPETVVHFPVADIEHDVRLEFLLRAGPRILRPNERPLLR